MRLYILIEDGKSFYTIFPYWIKLIAPSYSWARSINEMSENSYILLSGKGYPRLLGTDVSSDEKNVLGLAIETVNMNADIDMLIVCLDGDDKGVTERKKEADEKIKNYHVKLKCRYEILIQNKCVETWIMGNIKAFPMQPTTDFLSYYNHYSVRNSDPEYMEKPDTYTESTSIYHEEYLKMMFRERHMRYTKSSPTPEIQKLPYFTEMLNRIKTTNHLNSFRTFVDFFSNLSSMKTNK